MVVHFLFYNKRVNISGPSGPKRRTVGTSGWTRKIGTTDLKKDLF